MNITARLSQLDPTLTHHNEGESDLPYNPQKLGYSAFDDGGIECETGEFLYALARLIKPSGILETGTYLGVGAAYLGMALKDNQMGVLDTIEYFWENYLEAAVRIHRLGLSDVVVCHFGDATSFEPGEKKYKLILLDTEPQTRFEELMKFFPYLEDGGFVFIHDLPQHMHQRPDEERGVTLPFGPIPNQMREWVKKGLLKPFHFETPRGLTAFYKPHPDDYHWSE